MARILRTSQQEAYISSAGALSALFGGPRLVCPRWGGRHRRGLLLRAVGGGLLLGVCRVLVALKILATLACLATGWFGGQIFPGAFVGMAAALLPPTLHPSTHASPGSRTAGRRAARYGTLTA